MARMTLSQKTVRVVQFLVGLRNRRIRRALAAHGFTDATFEEGFELLKRVAMTHLGMQSEALDPRLIEELDAWENRWFPIISAVLRYNFPEVYAKIFLNLGQTSGPAVIVSVSTLLTRLDGVAAPVEDGGMGEQGSAALALLTERGVTAEVLGNAEALLGDLGTLEPLDDDDEEADRAAAEAAMERLWRWYLEWSAISRATVRDRRLLRALGFLRTTRNASGELVDEVVDDPDDETDDVTSEEEGAGGTGSDPIPVIGDTET